MRHGLDTSVPHSLRKREEAAIVADILPLQREAGGHRRELYFSYIDNTEVNRNTANDHIVSREISDGAPNTQSVGWS
ncbi:MAG: hypothetical protein JWO80_3069 [Bryobacterales bacterium]|nr:hypothetical protein [Bryobacterales bacterium]